jgi:opacity protein-like surface antigen
MKRVVVTVLAGAILVAMTSPLCAQTEEYLRRPHRVAISVDGGMAIPSKPSVYNDLWNTGWPFSIGATVSIFSWLEVGGGLTYGAFSISEINAKPAMGIVATSEVNGGDIKLLEYYGVARFIAIPNQRTSPFAEVEVGVHRITADDIQVEGSAAGPTIFPAFSNSMPAADGIHFAGGAGLRYALGDNWTAYTKFMWTVNLGNNFAPGDLVRRRGSEPTEGENMQFGTVIVGIMIRI